MSVVGYLPELGHLVVLEVYEHYDEPVLFAAKNERDQMFLAVLVQDDDTAKRWFYAPMSSTRFNAVRSGSVNLNTAFRNAEGDYLFEVQVSKIDTNTSGRWVCVVDLAEHELPEPTERLALKTITHPVAKEQNLVLLAAQEHCDILRLSFEFKDYTRTAAPAGVLGRMLDDLQRVVDSLGQYVCGRATRRGAVPGDVARQMRLDLVGIYAGSFGVELRANAAPDLLENSNASLALEKLCELLESTETDERLSQALIEFRGRTRLNYRDFLLGFGSVVRRVETCWASWRTSEPRRCVVTAEQARSALKVISAMAPEPPTEYEVTARLVGMNLRTRVYEILDVYETKKYSGKIDEKAVDSVRGAVIDDVYACVIRESVETSPSGEVDTSYRLLQLKRPVDEEIQVGERSDEK